MEEETYYVSVRVSVTGSCNIEIPATKEEYDRIAAGEDEQTVIENFRELVMDKYRRYAEEDIDYEITDPVPAGAVERGSGRECILVTVCDRDIVTKRYHSVSEARNAMQLEMIGTGYCCPADFRDQSGAPLKEGGDEEGTFGFSESGGFVNGRYEVDWQIEVI